MLSGSIDDLAVTVDEVKIQFTLLSSGSQYFGTKADYNAAQKLHQSELDAAKKNPRFALIVEAMDRLKADPVLAERTRKAEERNLAKKKQFQLVKSIKWNKEGIYEFGDSYTADHPEVCGCSWCSAKDGGTVAGIFFYEDKPSPTK